MSKGGDGQAAAGYYVRHASHAGSWYSKDPATLSGQLDGWLETARAEQGAGNGGGGAAEGPVRAVIAPHAGYRYRPSLNLQSGVVLLDMI
jgi:AmmeMemoRadiSam system protein B